MLLKIPGREKAVNLRNAGGGDRTVRSERQKELTHGFPGILHVKHRSEAEGFYLSKSAEKTICGLYIKTEHPLPKGARVLTAVTLPRAQQPIVVDCEVVWIKKNDNGKPAGMAVKFISISGRDRKILDVFFRIKPKK
jgi:Tfp pilus assembly protein PilZ